MALILYKLLQASNNFYTELKITVKNTFLLFTFIFEHNFGNSHSRNHFTRNRWKFL